MRETVLIGGKVSDGFFAATDKLEFDGYVPKGLGIGGSDNIEIEVEVETGRILGWDKDKFLEWMKQNGK